jgi:hypothetical protein
MNARMITQYMFENYQDHIDPTCNVLNCTTLAEDACDHFDLYEGNDIPEVLYDYALNVETALLRQEKINS